MLQLTHKQLQVYQIAMKLVEEVYKITRIFPKDEQFNLTSQLRRAAISVCSNLAEGSARYSKLEIKRFYEISRSSVVEIDTQFDIALNLEYLTKDRIKELESHLESVFKMLSKTMNNIQ